METSPMGFEQIEAWQMVRIGLRTAFFRPLRRLCMTTCSIRYKINVVASLCQDNSLSTATSNVKLCSWGEESSSITTRQLIKLTGCFGSIDTRIPPYPTCG